MLTVYLIYFLIEIIRATAQRFEPDHAFRDAKQVLHVSSFLPC